jgi:hypothetical protein
VTSKAAASAVWPQSAETSEAAASAFWPQASGWGFSELESVVLSPEEVEVVLSPAEVVVLSPAEVEVEVATVGSPTKWHPIAPTATILCRGAMPASFWLFARQHRPNFGAA